MEGKNYNIIGDIHARTNWRNVVREDCVNIFVGDYFDPYEYVVQVERMYNFQEILDFKQQHPETVLLYGNHDLHYLISEEHYSRFEPRYANEYWKIFMQNRSQMNGIAFAIGGKALVTHAGVTKEWYERYFGAYQGESPAEVADKINALWEKDKIAFTFEANTKDWSDFYGTSPTHSPVWIRPEVLVEHDLFAGTDIKQIVGHTQTGAGVMKDHTIVLVDCLGTQDKSYVITA